MVKYTGITLIFDHMCAVYLHSCEILGKFNRRIFNMRSFRKTLYKSVSVNDKLSAGDKTDAHNSQRLNSIVALH